MKSESRHRYLSWEEYNDGYFPKPVLVSAKPVLLQRISPLSINWVCLVAGVIGFVLAFCFFVSGEYGWGAFHIVMAVVNSSFGVEQ